MKLIKHFFYFLMPQRYWVLALCSGAMITLSQAPFQWPILAFIGLGSFFALLISQTSHSRWTQIGFLFGIGYFATNIYWVAISVHLFTNTWIVSILLTIIMVLILACFTAFFAWVSAFFRHRKEQIVIWLPLFWALTELLRGFFITSFPWGLIGYSQTTTVLAYYASIGSVYFVGFLVALISALWVQVLFRQQRSLMLVNAFIITSSLYFGGYLIGQTQQSHQHYKTISVALVQGNYTQNKKWAASQRAPILSYYAQTTQNHPADVIIWPENALPLFASDIPSYLQKINQIGQQQNSAIVVGILQAKEIDHQMHYYNTLQVFGDGQGDYVKSHLVPFGEYFPFPSISIPIMHWLNMPISQFTEGGHHQPLLQLNQHPVAAFICYESAFPFQVRQQSKHAEYLVISSDDGWFGDSLAPWQHLQIAQMRAIEVHRYIAQTTNSGITAVIRPDGSIQKIIAPNQQNVLVDYVQPRQQKTLWSMIGPWFLGGFLLLWALFGRFVNICKKQRSRLK